MNKNLSLVVVGCLFVSSLNASEIKSIFSKGTVSGDVTMYGEQQNNNGLNKDAGFSMGSIGLGYETANFSGFKAAVGFRGNHKFTEVEDRDYDAGNIDYPTALMHAANISYKNDYFSLTLGRQEIDLEWMGDFHEAYIGTITALEDTTIVVGHSDRIAVADSDAVLESFANLGNYGINVIDIKYKGIEGLSLNGYFYDIRNIADFYGVKVDYDNSVFGFTTQYAFSNEGSVTANDGSILQAEIRGDYSKFGLNIGYISTNKKAGIGSMDMAGDNINPLEDGNQVYEKNANTMYLGIGYELNKLALNAMYGSTKYGSERENEINFIAEYGITDEFSMEAIFVNVDANDGDDDYNKFALIANYTF